MKVSGLVTGVSLLIAAALLFLLMKAKNEAALARAETALLRAQLAEARARISGLEENQVDPALLKRLQADQRDAIKLRGELGSLKQSLTAAQKAAADATQKGAANNSKTNAAPAVLLPPEQNPAVRVLNAKAVANMPVGHALALGGWESSPGKRAFAFVSPYTDPASPGQVGLQTKWVEVSTEAAANPNLAAFFPTEGQQAAMSPEQFHSFLKQLELLPGVDVLSSPSILTASGKQGRVSVTEERQTPNGPVHFGPQMDVVPTLRADGSVDVAVEATYTIAAPNAGAAP